MATRRPNRQLNLLNLQPFYLVFFLLFTLTNAKANTTTEQIFLSNQVQQLLTVSNEMLNAATVNSLAEKIFSKSELYSNDVIAKISLLSAQVASNQGDINNVLLFTEKGLAVNGLDKSVKLSLLLKLAEVYAARKQYTQLLELTQKTVEESTLNQNVKYGLLALSYRSVAFSMLGEHQKALADLQQVEQGLSKSDLSEHIESLTILALAYHYLSDYQTSLTMQLKILKLRFEIEQKSNIAQTYLYLGYAYFYLGRFDDAYNAFWEARKAAELKFAPINIAHAEKGLGLVLLTQEEFVKSFPHLQRANQIFYQHNMLSSQIENLVALAKAKLENNETIEGNALLEEIITLLDGKDISLEYVGFYRMVATMYYSQNNFKRAYFWLTRYSQGLLEKYRTIKKKAGLVSQLSQQTVSKVSSLPIDESKRLALKLAENSELSSSFVGKYNKQRLIIISLLSTVLILLIIIALLFFRYRAKKISLTYDEVDKPSYAMSSSSQTKSYYQSLFKKARHFQYPLGVGYIIIDNWQELAFHFNKKTINEVKQEIAIFINQHLAEFDYAGVLSADEYLLLFEYQNNKEVDTKLKKLVQAINTRAFANLGDFSVIMKYAINTPGFKDIDPYLFLARITESVKNEQPKKLTVS
ncbi:hypothetical protein [Colwellia echini]|uniref:MalT-like TPR region domain-containing protein n=1 Tax=Colwellia echini TaxID=1982103 RepID=A0ABY3MXW5_9GAMM|nr:hypothetical protein [Colwellia echini]TYK66065.1 hypothetical protein CWS31_007295 [Colwellia echini]